MSWWPCSWGMASAEGPEVGIGTVEVADERALVLLGAGAGVEQAGAALSLVGGVQGTPPVLALDQRGPGPPGVLHRVTGPGNPAAARIPSGARAMQQDVLDPVGARPAGGGLGAHAQAPGVRSPAASLLHTRLLSVHLQRHPVRVAAAVEGQRGRPGRIALLPSSRSAGSTRPGGRISDSSPWLLRIATSGGASASSCATNVSRSERVPW